MSEDPEQGEKEFNEDKEEKLSEENEDDLETYLEEMKSLETDFSDLEDMDFEELKEIQEAIEKVKEFEEAGEKITEDLIIADIQVDDEEMSADRVDADYEADKEALISDFSDLDEIDFDELKEMQEAIEAVKQEELDTHTEDGKELVPSQEVSSELEERIKQELMERKEEQVKEVVTPEKFVDYASSRRDKIWYHALYYLVYDAEDHVASKQLLYEMLKENTSKSPIDPIQEHQFYFGLGYILRLTLNEKQIVRYLRGGKFKINISVDGLKEILEQAGEPIITKPVIAEDEKKQMFKDFLEDDFLDI